MSDAPSTLRLKPNALSSGDATEVRVEHVAQSLIDEGQTCTLQLVEVNEEGGNPQRVAEFKVVLQGGNGGAIRFKSVERIKASDELEGWSSSEKPPHVKLVFEGVAQEHRVVVAQPQSAEEGSAFELGLSLTDAAGTDVYPAGQQIPFARLSYDTTYPREINVYFWSDVDDSGQPVMSEGEMSRITAYAGEIWTKNGFPDVTFNIVDHATGKTMQRETGGPSHAMLEIKRIKGARGGYGKSLVGHSGRPGIGLMDTLEGWVVHHDKAEPGTDKDYYTAFVAAHEVLHQFLERAFWYLFAEFRSGSGHEDYDPGVPNEGEPKPMQHLNLSGWMTKVPKGPSPQLQTAEEIVFRQRRMLETLFGELREGTLHEWRQRLDRHKDEFDWKPFYEPAGKVAAEGLELTVIPLREGLAPIEEATDTQAHEKLREAHILFEQGKKAWYRDDDEGKFYQARNLLREIEGIEGFKPTPTMRREIDELLATIESEL